MKTVYKPWGKEEWLELNDKYCYKRIYINAGHKTSYQYHNFKRETNFLISGEAEIWLENDEGVVEKFIMKAGEYFNVTPPKKHRVIAITDIILQEVSTPEVDDVIRLEDDTNRIDGRLEHEHIKPAICIVAAGKGTRMGGYAKHINKGLLPIDNKAIISDVIDKTTDDYEIVVAVGYKSKQVIEYCKAAHPNRSFTFVQIDDFESKESGPGYSLLKCKEHLQRPFYFVTGDCLIKDKLPLLDSNWLGLYPTSIPEIYSTAKIDKNFKITGFKGKNKDGYDHAFIGLCGIFDFDLFWNELEANIKDSGEMVSAFYNIEKYNAVGKILNWYDIGTIENYIKAQKIFTPKKYGIPKTNGQFIYKVNNQCIKLFQESVSGKCHRADNLNGLVPNLVYKGENLFSYDWVDGTTLYESNLQDRINFIYWAGEEILKGVQTNVDITDKCHEFYFNKTHSRLSKYLEHASKVMKGKLNINGKVYKPISDYLNNINFEELSSNTLPTIRWHGDMQFDNIINTNQGFKFIDWRDNFGGSIDFGDAYYDLAKLYGGIHMNYSYMKDESNYTYQQNQNIINFSFKEDQEKEILLTKFEEMVNLHGYSFTKIKTLTSLIYLNMSPLHEKNLDHLLFANSIVFLDSLYG